MVVQGNSGGLVYSKPLHQQNVKKMKADRTLKDFWEGPDEVGQKSKLIRRVLEGGDSPHFRDSNKKKARRRVDSRGVPIRPSLKKENMAGKTVGQDTQE